MKICSFDIDIANNVGVLGAIIFNHILTIIRHNEANDENFIDGKYWARCSFKAFQELFPYYSRNQFRYAVKKLLETRLLIKEAKEENGTDRTNFYALGESGLAYICLTKPNGENSPMQWGKFTNAMVKNHHSNKKIDLNICSSNNITDTDTNTKSISNNLIDSLSVNSCNNICLNQEKKKDIYKYISKEEKNDNLIVKNAVNSDNAEILTKDQQIETSFNQFWEEYPTNKRKTNKKACITAWKNIPKILTEADNIIQGLRKWKLTDEWKQQNGQYIPAPLVFLHQEKWKAILEEPTYEEKIMNALKDENNPFKDWEFTSIWGDSKKEDE